MEAQADVCLGVVLYLDAPGSLERLFISLEMNQRQTDAPSQRVFFWDNSPTDRLREVVSAAGHGDRYQHSTENVGFGRAHNVLMSEAFGATTARAYVCVNPDAVLHPRCIAELVAESERQSRPGLVEALQFPDEHPKRYDRMTHATPWCSGCVLLVARPLYERIGGFDDRFFMYCEDVDLSWRARMAGFSTTVAPRALVHHWVGDRAPGAPSGVHMQRSGVLLGAKYGNAAFVDLCLRNHRLLGGGPLEPPPILRPSAPEIADFEHLFHFAQARW